MESLPASGHIRYRPDIDGLRAVAILSVVACHIQLHFFGGGYVGVDVFFVISGFLIGGILLREIAQNGSVSYRKFYEHRIRRIIPALFVMLAALSAAAYLVLLPKDLIEVAPMGIATLLFSGNIVLARSSGYFGPQAADNLLLHTWSLGVEEQFYIILPPLLVFLKGARGSLPMGPLLAGIAALSFAISVPASYLRPVGAFYLLPTRLWELLAGTLVFLYGSHLGKLSSRMQNILAGTGLALILLPLPLYGSATVFPGLAAVIPVIGAVLIIGTSNTWIHQLLSLRVLVFVGKISYSLYLWHWPLVVLNRIYPVIPQGRVSKLAIFSASMLMGWLSWRWVESPMRFGRFKPSRKVLFSASGLAAMVLLAYFSWTYRTGAIERFSPEEQRIASYRESGGIKEHFRVGQCFVEGLHPEID